MYHVIAFKISTSDTTEIIPSASTATSITKTFPCVSHERMYLESELKSSPIMSNLCFCILCRAF